MRIRITRATGYPQGALEQICRENGIATFHRDDPTEDTSIVATVTAPQLEKMRNAYPPMPHRIEEIEGEPEPVAQRLYTEAEYAQAVTVAYADGRDAGLTEAHTLAYGLGYQDLADTIATKREEDDWQLVKTLKALGIKVLTAFGGD